MRVLLNVAIRISKSTECEYEPYGGGTTRGGPKHFGLRGHNQRWVNRKW